MRGLQDGNLSTSADGTGCCPRALVIVPTRELAIQIYKEAVKFSTGTMCKVEMAYGGTSVAFQKERILRVSR